MQPNGATKRVLIVEDNFDNRAIYGMILLHRGYEVVEARNGEEGVRFAKEHQPHLILMDLSMPVLDGWSATAQLKQDEATAWIPVVMVTAHAATLDLSAARGAGFAEVLPKPVAPRRLVLEVERLIGAPASA